MKLRRRPVLADLARPRLGETQAPPLASGVHVGPLHQAEDWDRQALESIATAIDRHVAEHPPPPGATSIGEARRQLQKLSLRAGLGLIGLTTSPHKSPRDGDTSEGTTGRYPDDVAA